MAAPKSAASIAAVCDAGPLIHLGSIGEAHLLAQFSPLPVPERVRAEAASFTAPETLKRVAVGRMPVSAWLCRISRACRSACASARVRKFLRARTPSSQPETRKTISFDGFVNCETTNELRGFIMDLPRRLANLSSGFRRSLNINDLLGGERGIRTALIRTTEKLR